MIFSINERIAAGSAMRPTPRRRPRAADVGFEHHAPRSQRREILLHRRLAHISECIATQSKTGAFVASSVALKRSSARPVRPRDEMRGRGATTMRRRFDPGTCADRRRGSPKSLVRAGSLASALKFTSPTNRVRRELRMGAT